MRLLKFIVIIALVGCGAPASAQTGALQGPSRGLGTWSEKTRLPDIRSEAANAFVNGKLYVMGGLARMQEASMLVQEWDPATDRWRDRAPMPGPLSHPNATTLNGKIYVVGGFLLQVHAIAQNAAYEYDPEADRWRTLAPLKTPRGSIAVVALGGRIHAIGGRTPTASPRPSTRCTTRRRTRGATPRRCRRRATISRSPRSTGRSM